MKQQTEKVTPASLQKQASPFCSKCGSGDIRTEAFAKWSGRDQDWEIAELLDGNTCCNECGQDCEIKWRLD